jgi:hypothetical protein
MVKEEGHRDLIEEKMQAETKKQKQDPPAALLRVGPVVGPKARM